MRRAVVATAARVGLSNIALWRAAGFASASRGQRSGPADLLPDHHHRGAYCRYRPPLSSPSACLLLSTIRSAKMLRSDITPDAPLDEQPTIGLIGMGEMGRMYAKRLSQAGWGKYGLFALAFSVRAHIRGLESMSATSRRNSRSSRPIFRVRLHRAHTCLLKVLSQGSSSRCT